MKIISDYLVVSREAIDKKKPKYQKHEDLTWVLVEGKEDRKWIIPINVENQADYIHLSNCVKNGYGGSTLKFKLDDGSVVEFEGPWHSNSDAFYRDTKIDIRNRNCTFCIIAKDRKYKSGYAYADAVDVLYVDDNWTYGYFKRGDDIAKGMANVLGEQVYLWSFSLGGSSCGPVKPDVEEKE